MKQRKRILKKLIDKLVTQRLRAVRCMLTDYGVSALCVTVSAVRFVSMKILVGICMRPTNSFYTDQLIDSVEFKLLYYRYHKYLELSSQYSVDDNSNYLTLR